MEIVFMIAVWTTVAALAGVYASKKGYRGGGWFCFAFFVPFGALLVWPILLSMRTKPQPLSELEQLEQEVRMRKAKAELAQLQQIEG
jgi:hypothetical protein